MKAWWNICLLAIPFTCLGMDLSKIDRTIGKEPSYKNKPGYCLLVFGPEAKTRIWLVRDGQTIYVDRNANGDLTDRGEAVDPAKARVVNSSHRDTEYPIGILIPKDGSGPHTDFKITAYSSDNYLWNYVLTMKVNGRIEEFAGWNPIFKPSRETAPILHFGGSLVPQPIRFRQFSLASAQPELHLRFATPGLGEGSTVSLGCEAIPQYIAPMASIHWPGSNASTSVRLLSRC